MDGAKATDTSANEYWDCYAPGAAGPPHFGPAPGQKVLRPYSAVYHLAFFQGGEYNKQMMFRSKEESVEYMAELEDIKRKCDLINAQKDVCTDEGLRKYRARIAVWVYVVQKFAVKWGGYHVPKDVRWSVGTAEEVLGREGDDKINFGHDAGVLRQKYSQLNFKDPVNRGPGPLAHDLTPFGISHLHMKF